MLVGGTLLTDIWHLRADAIYTCVISNIHMFIGTCSKETKEEIQHTYIKEVPLIWSDLIDSKWFRGLFRTIGRSFGTLTVSRHFDMFTGFEILFKYKVIYHFIGVIFQMGQSAKIHFPMPCGTRSFQTGNVKWQPHSLLSPSPNSLLINLSTFLMFYILLSSSPISTPWWCCSSTWRPETVILSLLLPAPKSSHTGTQISSREKQISDDAMIKWTHIVTLEWTQPARNMSFDLVLFPGFLFLPICY